jgi:hypothetical protein
MEHILPIKSVAQVLNTTVTLTWSAVDFGRAFPESIIKHTVSMRLSCTTTATQAVNVGVRYSTATKDYRVAERKTIAQIPASGSVEITPAGVAALGLLNEYIISITVELTAASTGTTTVTLIIDDDPPPLSNDAGEFRGLDAINAFDYIPFQNGVTGQMPLGATGPTLLYAVPSGKRAYLDIMFALIAPTPSFADAAFIQFWISLPAVGVPKYWLLSLTDRSNVLNPVSLPFILPSGAGVYYYHENNTQAAVQFELSIFGREIF